MHNKSRCTRLVVVFCLITAFAGSALAAKRKLLIASDIHFNPMADASLVTQLAGAEAAQWEAILSKTTPHSFSPYGQDTNWWLLQSSLDQMRKTMPHPAVFLILGDMLAHHFPKTFRDTTHDNDLQHYRAFVLKTMQFLALQLRQRWPDTQILITPGNDDDDCGDYTIEAGGAFLSDTAPIMRDLAKADDKAVADWKALGSYTLQPAALPGVTMVSVNTVFFSENYEARSFQHSCQEVQSNAFGHEYGWLTRTLSAAQQRHQKVWLMYHIPTGIDGYASTHGHNRTCAANVMPFWVPEWTVKFVSDLIGHQSTVAASFAGHTHTDSFQVLREGETPVGFALIDPPISPIYDQNPAFRVADVEGSEVRDVTTYYLTNLTTAGAKQRGKWKKEYVFSRTWKVKQIDPASLHKIYNQIATNDAARAQWLKLYNVSSPAAKVPSDTVRGLYCAMEGIGVGAYRKCACVAGQ
jgi:sphingomyelin phosphodiesterase acid-like 3